MSSFHDVTNLLIANEFVSEDDIAESCRLLETQAAATPSGAQLLKQLVLDGKLTPFQATEIQLGRASGLIVGNCVLLNRVGEGGMGVVYKARHRRMLRVVAVKLMKEVGPSNEFLLERFRREVQVAARLNHPNIIAAFDSGACDDGDFLVMEYIEGMDLARLVDKSGPMSPSDATEAILQSASALGYAHSLGVIHRDIKPANLLRDISGVIKVADLGLARVEDQEAVWGTALTNPGLIMGTVDFMSPEQAIDSSSVDPRADIYSLGCTWFSLLIGEPIFSGKTVRDRLTAHRDKPAPSLRELRADIPREHDRLFQKMVAKLPEDRFASMFELVEALETLDRRARAESIETWDLSRASALVVEPSPLQGAMISKLVKDAGAKAVHTCKSANEAMELMSAHPSDVVLTSMRLAEMSGLALATRIRDELRWSRVPIVIMTSDDLAPRTLSAVESLGRVGVLRKPFKSAELAVEIERAFRDEARNLQPLAGLDGLEVLIVDDSPLAQQHVQKTLLELGFENFTFADDGEKAVERLERARFHLVVTDYKMPGLNGKELVSYIRHHSNQRTAPIVMCTTEYDPAKLAEVYLLGVSAICKKTFERDLVRNIVIRLFL